MRLFEIDRNKVSINPAALGINEFKVLWLRDKDKEKRNAILELSYIYFISDYKSIYLSVPPEDRENTIIDDLFEDKYWKPDKEVQAAIKKYEELQTTPSMRFLKSQLSALEKSIGYFESIDYKKLDHKGRPVYDITSVTNSMSKSAAVLDSLEKIAERVKKELDIKGKIRGGGEISPFED